MRKLAWWHTELEGRRIFNELADEVTSMGGESAGAVERLILLDRAQAREISHLRAVVEALADMLVDNGLLDEATLRLRIEAEVVNTLPDEPPPAPVSAFEQLSRNAPRDPAKKG